MAKNGYYRPARNNNAKKAVFAVGLLLIIAVVVYVMWLRNRQAPMDTAQNTPAPPAELQIITPPDLPQEPSPVQDPAPEPPPEPVIDDRAEDLFRAGADAIAADDYVGAREKLSQAVAAGLKDDRDKQARQLLNEVSDKWLFSRDMFAADAFCQRYKVKSGDMLIELGKQFGVPHELLMRINGIKDARSLAAGETIKVVQGTFHAQVKLSSFLLSVYLDDVLVRSYPVGLGKPGRETPTGKWLVRRKQYNPEWVDVEQGKVYPPDDPDNPLGEHWIGLEGLEGNALGRTGFGIHGTIQPDEIGQTASRGCIRLHNKDVEELYDLLTCNKSEVLVID